MRAYVRIFFRALRYIFIIYYIAYYTQSAISRNFTIHFIAHVEEGEVTCVLGSWGERACQRHPDVL